MIKTLLSVLVLISASLTPAFAHWADVDHHHGFITGFIHPLTGLDHVLAMLALGLWAGYVGGMARWVWPLTFVAMAGFSALLGQTGHQFWGIEPLIASSIVVLGGFVLFGLRFPIFTGLFVSACAAFAHGYAHGLEMVVFENSSQFLAGFLLTTGLLHGTGLLLSLTLNGTTGRITGGLITLLGSYFLWMAI